MRLYVRLFYILLIVFIGGIVLVCCVDKGDVLSRVGTGLITGAFVGLITTITNYYNIRQSYFENLVLLITDATHGLNEDLRHAVVRNAWIARMPKNEMIKHSSGEKKYRAYRNETHKMEKKYATLASRFDFEAFVPLFPFVGKRLRGLLEELENLFCFRLKSLHAFYLTCFDFCLLSAKVSKEEQLIVIGDPDEFYDYVVQENVDFQDRVAFLLNTLADYSECLLRMIKHTCSKMYRDILNDEIDMVRRLYLKDIVIRDVFDERSKENPESGIEPTEIAAN